MVPLNQNQNSCNMKIIISLIIALLISNIVTSQRQIGKDIPIYYFNDGSQPTGFDSVFCFSKSPHIKCYTAHNDNLVLIGDSIDNQQYFGTAHLSKSRTRLLSTSWYQVGNNTDYFKLYDLINNKWILQQTSEIQKFDNYNYKFVVTALSDDGQRIAIAERIEGDKTVLRMFENKSNQWKLVGPPFLIEKILLGGFGFPSFFKFSKDGNRIFISEQNDPRPLYIIDLKDNVWTQSDKIVYNKTNFKERPGTREILISADESKIHLVTQIDSFDVNDIPFTYYKYNQFEEQQDGKWQSVYEQNFDLNYYFASVSISPDAGCIAFGLTDRNVNSFSRVDIYERSDSVFTLRNVKIPAPPSTHKFHSVKYLDNCETLLVSYVSLQQSSSPPYTDFTRVYDLSQSSSSEELALDQMKISPNPSSDYITLETRNDNEPVLHTIVDITGRTYPIVNDKTTIDITNLSSGLYFLVVQNKTKLRSFKFIKI